MRCVSPGSAAETRRRRLSACVEYEQWSWTANTPIPTDEKSASHMSEITVGKVLKTEKMSGGKAVVETLKAEGVDTVFGIISIHMLPIYDTLSQDKSIRLVIPRHEMAGGFMADAYSRVTGKPGVYMTSTGPGAANAMGAVIESWCASSQTLHLTGQIQTYNSGKNKGMLHEVKDQVGMFRATGCEAEHINKTVMIPKAIHHSFQRMRSGRPAPQMIEMPIDQQYSSAEVEIHEPLKATLPVASPEGLDRAANLLAAAKRPVIWIGGGVNLSGAHEELERLAKASGAAVFLTRGGRGAISEDNPQVIGNYFGERPARMFLQNADCVLAVGTKFSWHSTSEWTLKLTENLIRIDVDLEQLQHNYKAAAGLHSDALPALAGIANRLEYVKHQPSPEFLAETAALKEELRSELRTHRPLTAEMMDIIDAHSPKDRILATDATLPAYWGANQYLPVRRKRGFVTPRLAAIGPGYPMALGAQAAFPNDPVLCIAGDGGFMFHIGELATAVQENLNVVLLVFNNFAYGVLKKLQQKTLGGRVFAVDLHTPDFAKVAEGFGMKSETVTEPGQLGAALDRAWAAKAPYLIDVQAPFEM